MLLILFGRKACCLCEGLEARLRNLPLDLLMPPLDLCVIDIDDSKTAEDLRARYDMQVPVLLLAKDALNPILELPRVSPRLDEKALFNWLQKFLTNLSKSD